MTRSLIMAIEDEFGVVFPDEKCGSDRAIDAWRRSLF